MTKMPFAVDYVHPVDEVLAPQRLFLLGLQHVLVIATPISISDSHCRARAIAVTSFVRVSERIGRTRVRGAPSGAMTSRWRR
jgi:hypothetical protein